MSPINKPPGWLIRFTKCDKNVGGWLIRCQKSKEAESKASIKTAMKQTMENIPAAKIDKKLEDDANDLMFDGDIHFIFTDFIFFCRQLCETTE